MTSYRPPTANYPLFDPSVFDTSTTPLTQEEGDERYVRFPVAQGAQTFPANVTMQGVSTIGNATFTDVNPAYEINYPVNSGTINFYSNTAGGVSTRGCKIDSTGVHTNGKIDTINETGGILDIGVNANRTAAINIGTGGSMGGAIGIGSGASAKNITIGSGAGGTTLIRGGTVNISSNGLSNNTLFSNATGGSLTILPNDATVSNTVLNIASGSAYTGTINIGNGASSKTIILGNTTGGTITINRPLTAGYTGTTPDSTQIGYKADIAGLVYSTTSLPSGTADITTSAFSIPNGVWLVNVVLIANMNAGAGNYLRLSLSTSSGNIQSARTIDFNPNTTGNNYFNYTTTIANAVATNYYLVSQTGTITATSVTLTINLTRIA